MTDIEFREWLGYHFAAFRNIESFFADMDETDERDTLAFWKKTLAPCEQEDCVKATELMHQEGRPKLFPSDHPSEVRRLALWFASKRNPPPKPMKSLAEASRRERSNTRTNMKHVMRVNSEVVAMHKERIDAGMYRQPIEFRKRWAKMFGEARRIISESRPLPFEEYADLTIEAYREVHRSCMEELAD